MTRIIIKNGDTELPEAELASEVPTGWSVRFLPEATVNVFNKQEWPDSYVVEPKRELPTKLWSVIQFPGTVPFTLTDSKKYPWRTPFASWVDPAEYGNDWVELVPRD